MALGLGSGLHSGFIGEEENRWLRREFQSDQTSYSNPMVVTSFGTGWTGANDDTYSLKYDLYLTGLGGNWGGSGSNVNVSVKMEGNTDMVSVSVPLNTVTSIEQSGTGNVDSNATIMQISTPANYPSDGDVFYVRDLVIEVYGADGTLKVKKEWDFKEGGSLTPLDGVGLLASTNMTGTFSTSFGQNPL